MFNLKSEEKFFKFKLTESIVPIFLIIYCLLCLTFTGALLAYHFSLIYKNITTKEEMRISPLKIILNSYVRKNFCKQFSEIIFPNYSQISLLEKLKIRFAELEKVIFSYKIMHKTFLKNYRKLLFKLQKAKL